MEFKVIYKITIEKKELIFSGLFEDLHEVEEFYIRSQNKSPKKEVLNLLAKWGMGETNFSFTPSKEIDHSFIY